MADTGDKVSRLSKRGTPSKILVMDINEDITKELAMSGKLKMADKIEGGSTTESDSTENSKSKKRCESSMRKVDPKMLK